MRAAATNAMSGKQLVMAGVAGVFAATAMLINAALQLAWRQPYGLQAVSSSQASLGIISGNWSPERRSLELKTPRS
jgi:hypothetical protein